MASYGILGFLAGAGEAGGKAAEEAQKSHNENVRLKMAEELADKRLEKTQQFQVGRDEVKRGWDKDDYTTLRTDQVTDREANNAAAIRQAEIEAEIKASEGEAGRKHDFALESHKAANKGDTYSAGGTAKNPATGKVEQYRINNRTNEPVWLGIEPEVDPTKEAQLRKINADALVSEGKVQDLTAKGEKAGVVQENALRIVNRLLKDEGSLKAVTGGFDASWASPTIMQSSIDAENDLNALRSLLTMDNLDAMTGVLSESDILMLKEVSAAGLNPSNSTKRVKEALELVRDRMTASRASASAQAANTPKQPAPGTQYKNMSDEEFMKTRPGLR